MTPLAMDLATNEPSETAPANSAIAPKRMACLSVSAPAPYEVPTELAMSLAAFENATTRQPKMPRMTSSGRSS